MRKNQRLFRLFALVFLGFVVSVRAENDTAITWFPVVFYTPETGAGLGAGVVGTKRPNGRLGIPDTLSFVSFVTAQNQFFFLAVPEVYRGPWKFEMPMSYLNHPDDFYGVGAVNSEKDKDPYSAQGNALKPSVSHTVWKNLRAGVFFDTGWKKISDFNEDQHFGPSPIPGEEGGRTSGAGPTLEWDDRDNLFSPSKGGVYHLEVGRYRPGLGSDYRYNTFVLDTRRYVSFFPSKVLAFQAVFERRTGDVPFYEWPRLENLRGIIENRYRDENSLLIQTEYRFPLKKRLSGVAFGGAGSVWGKSPWRFQDVKPAGGGGLRYALNEREKINLRVDLGFSADGANVYVRMLESF